ncbi:hypothetical protein EON79_01845 [bacterium]|nr:MAG: hypothetical protein EON79_01845 [bacterium]
MRQEGRRAPSFPARAVATLLAALSLAPIASAAEGENVQLHFAKGDFPFLAAALAFGVFALFYAAGLVVQVMKADPGNEAMRQVQSAIKDGALAYLKKQSRAMAIFGAILFVGLIGLNFAGGLPVAIGIAVCFAFGAVGSYAAGYTGMVMAVNGNARTAHAATQSYRRALEVSFRSGAVAGLVTVGIGLVGASAILLLGRGDAVRYLVGFGFGGSLAALFMRVGGGIFTKAADVGADLVGKVEAGIPEDDPRNPAVIADNVGDNVGDCAGMAADVFESYAVTLISVIVLAAATRAVLDGTTWLRLVIFGMMAAGIGLMASLVGIASLKGNDDLASDPLVPIRRGFNITALLGLLGTATLAFFFMGGTGKNPIVASSLRSTESYKLADAREVQAIRERLVQQPVDTAKIKAAIDKKAVELKKAAALVTSDDLYQDLQKVPAELKGIPQAAVQRYISRSKLPVTKYDITGTDIVLSKIDDPVSPLTADDTFEVGNQLAMDLSAATSPELKGFTRVTDPNDPEFPQLRNATLAAGEGGATPAKPYIAIGDKLLKEGDDQLVVRQVSMQVKIPPQPATANSPAFAGRDIDVKNQWLGPASKKALDDMVESQRTSIKASNYKGEIEVHKTIPVSVFANHEGKLLVAVPSDIDRPYELTQTFAVTMYPLQVQELEEIQKEAQAGRGTAMPSPMRIDLAVAETRNVEWWRFVLAFTVGLVLALAIEKLTEYYVSTHRRPTQEVAGVSSAGAAPMIIQGFAYACESSAMMVFLIVIALLCPLFIFPAALYGGYALPLFGVALVGLGMLSTTAYVLAMDTFGPISDNAQGVYEMSGMGETNVKGAKIVSHLDAAGNTTKALTKGFAIATAVVASIALFHSYLDSTKLSAIGLKLDVPEIFLGLLIGGAAPFLFSAFAINAVGRSAFRLIHEVRRQFREDPGIMLGTSRPDYARCVAIVTEAAQRELVGPGILAIALPVAVGFGFSIGKAPMTIDGGSYNLTGAQALGGFLAGTILSGQLLAVLLANSGGMWDNAKKLIEDGNFGGKGSENHKASVICDTVGDPFKDTAGPALNPLIKVMNLVALLLAPVIILPVSPVITVLVTLVAVAALVFAVYNSKKGSFSDDMRTAAEEAAAADVKATIDPAPKPAKKKLTIED